MSDPQNTDQPAEGAIDLAPAVEEETVGGLPTTTELEEPSTEKQPSEEPVSPAPDGDDGASHHAVGIGVIDHDSDAP